MFYIVGVHWVAVWNEIRRIMGWDQGNSFGYLFHSGSGATIELGIWGTILWWWKTSCQAHRFCLRHGAHKWTDPETNLTHMVCWKHGGTRKYIGERIRGFQEHTHLYFGKKPGKG